VINEPTMRLLNTHVTHQVTEGQRLTLTNFTVISQNKLDVRKRRRIHARKYMCIIYRRTLHPQHGITAPVYSRPLSLTDWLWAQF